MKPSELFGVVIRAIGLLLLMFAISQLLMGLRNLVGGGPSNVAAMMISAIPSLLIGLWFLRGAPLVVSYAYTPDRNDQIKHTQLERDTLQVMALLQAGKTEEAKAIVDKILNS